MTGRGERGQTPIYDSGHDLAPPTARARQKQASGVRQEVGE